MRLLLTLIPLEECSFNHINKHAVQGMIYSMLKGTDLETFHDSSKFKFFCFSDIFPLGDFEPKVPKYLLISSPNTYLIDTLTKSLIYTDRVTLKGVDFKVKNIKRFTPKLSNRWTSGSPIVLYKDNRKNLYYSFERDGDLNFFLERVKENAVKKYNAFYNEDIYINENIFDRLIFKKEVAVKDFKDGAEFIIIGSVWKLFEKFEMPREQLKFYKFILGCGLGEKNSLGFGLVNPMR